MYANQYYFYINIFDLNQQNKDYPQIVGMSGDLAEPNSFVTIEDFGSSIIAARDPQGKFRAYANVCSHRGAEIEQEKKGVKSKFSCPFHGWTFNNEGDLVGFRPNREWQFLIDGKRLYCMKSNDIVIKYEYQGNEEEYNPSWASSSKRVN